MATLTVRKDNSGAYTEIQSAVFDSVTGDVIDIGPGTFNENIDLMGKSITLQGAGRDQTIIQGKLANDPFVCSWFAGDDTLTTSSTVGAIRGRQVSGTSLTAGSRISQVVSGTQIKITPASPSTGNYTKTVAAYQTVAFSVAPTTGTFKLAYNGTSTAAINWNDSAATIQTKLRAIPGLTTVVVTGTISGKLLTVTFDSVALPVTAMTVNSSTINATITVSLIEALVQGSSTVILPNTTSVAVGHKVEGTGVNATITAWNSATRTITLSSPITQTGSGVLLTFRLPRSNITVNQLASSTSISVPSTIQVYGITNGLQIKDLTAIGFDNSSPGQEASALAFHAPASPGHQNFLIDGCRFTAAGDCAVLCGSNPYLNNGTFQNCIFDGKTFTGSEPADIPSFSSFSAAATIKSIGASSSVLTFSDVRGMVVNQGTSSISWTGSATIQAISGNDVTINKVLTQAVGDSVTCNFTLVAYSVPNAARNLVYIGQNTTPCNTQNITFKNNQVKGQTGAVCSGTGNRSMFNSAVTIESVGGLVEGNTVDGIFGAGQPNTLAANFAIRCRQANIIVRNNVNKISGGRGNSGFYITGAGATDQNNRTIAQGIVQVVQSASGVMPKGNQDPDQVKEVGKVSADPVFSDSANWTQASYIFKHKTSGKRMIATFRVYDIAQLDDMALRSGNPGDEYQLVKVILCKAGRQLMNLKRSELSDPAVSDYTLL